jgi:4-amino-4-deoxy-L-arabinose transferase-like glycosyltransferase
MNPQTHTSNRLNRLQFLLLGLILVSGIALRLYRLNEPPLDFHPTRQLRSALIARNVYLHLKPDADQAARVQAAELGNLEIYEPPILEQIVGATYLLTGEKPGVARVWNALFWIIGGLALFGFTRRFASYLASLAALLFYLFLPFSVIASRSFQPDPWMVMWILLTTWALSGWIKTPTWKWSLLCGALAGMAVVVKIFAAFFIGGLLAAAVLCAFGLRHFWRKPQVWLMAALAILPAFLVYFAFNTQRSGEFLSYWTLSLAKLWLDTKFYSSWLAMVGGLMGLGLPLVALLGICITRQPERFLLIALWVGYGLFGLSSPYQFTTHEYYHLSLIPLVGMGLAPVLDVLLNSLKNQAKIWQAVALAALIFTLGYNLWIARSQIYVANFANEPTAWRNVGKAVPDGHSFIALTADYGMRLRYYGLRSGFASWPSTADFKLEALRAAQTDDFDQVFKELTSGREYFLVTAFSELEAQPQLKENLAHLPIFAQGDGFIVYSLNQ